MKTPTVKFFEEESVASGRFEDMERRSFEFRHRLSDLPLMQMDALSELVAYFQQHALACHFEIGEARAEDGWANRPDRIQVSEALRRLPDGNVLIVLKAAHRHPDYAALLGDYFAELAEVMHTDLASRYRTPICTILLASPRRVTPYHMDDSHNLLMQVHGCKTFYVFDGRDPEIVSEREQEEFWGGNQNAARHSEAKQRKAWALDLGPGIGVHLPMLYPHWAVNGEDVSVAISINFAPRRNSQADIFALNARLKRFGLTPTPPGRSRVLDASKLAAFRTLGSIKRLSAHH
jgi:hypothetical protein